MNLFGDNSETIGRTPLVHLSRFAPAGMSLLGKVEGRNPSGSVKCRLGAALIWDAERRGQLRNGVEILEATSGNTGIALAFVAAARGYKLTLVMPDDMSIERRKVLDAYGATVVLSDGAAGMAGAVKMAQKIWDADPVRYFMPKQFDNPANPEIHERTTGPEIWGDTDGWVDVVISGVGTGGTITGVSRYIKETKKKPIVSVAVEPAESPVITQRLAGERILPGQHEIQGIGAGFIPNTLDLSMVDMVERVTSAEAMAFTKRLAREEGILCGISSGAAIAVAVRLASRPEFAGRCLVVILPDAGERYLSSPLFDSTAT